MRRAQVESLALRGHPKPPEIRSRKTACFSIRQTMRTKTQRAAAHVASRRLSLFQQEPASPASRREPAGDGGRQIATMKQGARNDPPSIDGKLNGKTAISQTQVGRQRNLVEASLAVSMDANSAAMRRSACQRSGASCILIHRSGPLPQKLPSLSAISGVIAAVPARM